MDSLMNPRDETFHAEKKRRLIVFGIDRSKVLFLNCLAINTSNARYASAITAFLRA